MPSPRLDNAALAGLAGARLRLPTTPRARADPGVVHLGLGAFHRAHQAMVFDDLLQRGDSRWGVLGVAMRNAQVAQALDAQDGLYSVQVTSATGKYWQVVGALRKTCVAAREPERVAAAIAAPTTRWTTLTVTEKGYTPELAALIVRGLALRRDAGLSGLTIASCDNLSGNGDLLRDLCLAAAADVALNRWVGERCAFPNSMVDRIVPAATDQCRREALQALGHVDEAALATEGFWEWVLQDHFADPADAEALRAAGVSVVPDVRPFEEAKLRMLNGTHSALACIGAVAGLPTVADCIAQPAVSEFVRRLMTVEVMPHLARPDLAAYRDALLARFANVELRHSVHQIATDSSRKIPQRWVPAAVAQLQSKGPVEYLAFAAAAWMRYCLGEDEAGRSYVMSDPMAGVLQPLARMNIADPGATVKAFLAIESVWGTSVPGDPRWTLRVAWWLHRIHSYGTLQALGQLNRNAAPA